MALHGVSGLPRISGFDGRQNRCMFSQCDLPGLRALEIIAQALEQRTVAGMPVALQRIEEHPVATGVCNGEVKGFQDTVLKNKPLESLGFTRADFDKIQAAK